MSNHPFCNSPFCCNIIHIITVKNVICKKSLKLPFPDVNAGHMEHVLFTQPKSASAARGSLFEVCMGLYLISCVKVPLFGQNALRFIGLQQKGAVLKQMSHHPFCNSPLQFDQFQRKNQEVLFPNIRSKSSRSFILFAGMYRLITC